MDTPTLQILRSAWSIFGLFGLAIAASTVCAFYAFRYLSAKWLEEKFSRRLEVYKHAQQQELERLKFKINALVDRSAKISEKEFLFLPQVWVSLVDTYYKCSVLTNLIKQYPNLNFATEERLEAFIEAQDITNWQKSEFRAASDKSDFWIDICNRRELVAASNAHNQLTTEMMKYSIFFHEDFKIAIQKFARTLIEVIIEYDMYEVEKEAPRERKARNHLMMHGEAEMQAIERMVRSRLWNAEHAEL